MTLNVEGQDLVAIAAIVGSCVLIYAGHNGGVVTIFSTIIGYYFGRKSVGRASGQSESQQSVGD